MSNLNSFAELMKQAAEEKSVREESDRLRKEKEVTPLLSELFKTVAKAKNINHGVTQNRPESHQIEEQLVTTQKQNKTIQSDSNEERNFTKILNRLQSDIANLQRQLVSRPTYSSGWGSSGGGEVRVLRMDDVIRETPVDADLMIWDSLLNKFVFGSQSSLLSVTHNVINKETTILADTSYSVIGYLHLKAPLIIHGNVKIT